MRIFLHGVYATLLLRLLYNLVGPLPPDALPQGEISIVLAWDLAHRQWRRIEGIANLVKFLGTRERPSRGAVYTIITIRHVVDDYPFVNVLAYRRSAAWL